MKILVFTPTNKPGIDITLLTLARQTLAQNITWVISDEYYEQRKELWSEVKKLGWLWNVFAFQTPRLTDEGAYLSSSYNKALEIGRMLEVDLFISLQDYIWVLKDGVEKFWNRSIAEPKAILTGLTSISGRPLLKEKNSGPFEISTYSIFGRKIKQGKMNLSKEVNCNIDQMHWIDCRTQRFGIEGGPIVEVHPIEWEMNWSAIPREILKNENVNFDTRYDKGIAYENQDYAAQCQVAGYKVLLDKDNVSLAYRG